MCVNTFLGVSPPNQVDDQDQPPHSLSLEAKKLVKGKSLLPLRECAWKQKEAELKTEEDRFMTTRPAALDPVAEVASKSLWLSSSELRFCQSQLSLDLQELELSPGLLDWKSTGIMVRVCFSAFFFLENDLKNCHQQLPFSELCKPHRNVDLLSY